MKVLVSAASRHGSTSEIADALAAQLVRCGLEATVAPPDEAADPAQYDAVVLGSAVYAGRWLEAARHFAQEHWSTLRGRPVWLFSSGPIGEPLQPTEADADGARLSASLEARGLRVFPGRLDRTELGFAETVITRMIRAPDGDFRDFAAIRAWAEEIGTALLGAEEAAR
jgi:menaquinone-dependent protoporphyrinogen oxidase